MEEEKYAAANMRVQDLGWVLPDDAEVKRLKNDIQLELLRKVDEIFKKAEEQFDNQEFANSISNANLVLDLVSVYNPAEELLTKASNALIEEYEKRLQEEFSRQENLKFALEQAKKKQLEEQAAEEEAAKLAAAKKVEEKAAAKDVAEKEAETATQVETEKALADEVDEMYESAVTFSQRGFYLVALEKLEDILNEDSDYQDAIDLKEEILGILEANIDTYLEDGVEYYTDNEFDSALEEFEKILAVDPDHEKALDYYEKIQAKLEKIEQLESFGN